MKASDTAFYEMKARIIGVMANPRRLQMVDLLGGGDKTVSELSEAMGLRQATTSQHLAVMRKAGVVETSRDGNYIRYRLADHRIASACSVMSQAVANLLVTQQKKLQPVLKLAAKQRRR